MKCKRQSGLADVECNGHSQIITGETIVFEYGIVFNNDQLNGEFAFQYPYCSFQSGSKIYVAEPYRNRIAIIDEETQEMNMVSIAGWFPRWIQIIEHETIAFLDSKRKVLGCLHHGEITLEVELPMRHPLCFTRASDGRMFVGGKGDYSLLVYDEGFNLIGQYLSAGYCAQSVQLISDNRLLICDSERHQVFISDFEGRIEWEYGKSMQPGEQIDELSTPRYAWFKDGKIFIADGRNNRIICIGLDKEIKYIYSEDMFGQCLWWPVCLDVHDTFVMVTDAGNGRIVKLDYEGRELWHYGRTAIKKFVLNNPRGIELDDNSFLLADTYNHRILRFSPEKQPEVFWGGIRGTGTKELFWPRAIRKKDDETYVIADSRNARLVVVTKEGDYVRMINGFYDAGHFHTFSDPHDIDAYEDRILITDSSLGLIIELDNDGHCTWAYGRNGELCDPHHARRTSDGGYIISDTGNDRILKISSGCDVEYEISITDKGGLRKPRWSEEVGDLVLVTDSGNGRIILVDRNGRVIMVYSETKGSFISRLRNPRCTRYIDGKILVSDTYNNRIIYDVFD